MFTFFGGKVYKEDSNGNILLRKGFDPLIHIFIGPRDVVEQHIARCKNCIVYKFSKTLFSKTEKLLGEFEHGKDLILICNNMDCLSSIPSTFKTLVYEYDFRIKDFVKRYDWSKLGQLKKILNESECECNEKPEEFPEEFESVNENSWNEANLLGGTIWYK